MFNKILLICLLLTHLQITAFAIETEERPTESWFRLVSPYKVTPEINDQYLVQLRITQKPEIEKTKRCSFLYIFRALFKPAKKMAASNSAISLSIEKIIPCNVQLEEENANNPPEIGGPISLFVGEKLKTEENSPLFVTPERPSSRKVRSSSDEEFIPLKQKHIEFIPMSEMAIFQEQEKYFDENSDDGFSSRSSDVFDDEFSYEFPEITTDESITLLANNLIKGLFPFCNVGKFGKFTLNDEHGPFTKELSFDTSWFIKKNDSKITGLAIRWYDEDDDRDDEYAAVIHKTLLIPEY